jgi:phospholipid-transporting ATPase
VTLGIKGVEGQQAARASDYAIGEFKALRRLVFLYGRESYRRNSVLVLYSFYKNIVLVMPQFWYAIIFVNFSGNTLYDSYMYQLVNVIYTSLPIMFYAVFDRDATDDELTNSPQYYYPGPKKLYFNSMVFWQWFTYACFQSIIIVLLW